MPWQLSALITSPRLVTASRNAFSLRSLREQRRRVAVRVARIGARADLHRLHAQLDEIVERLLERLVAEEDRENTTDLHSRDPILSLSEDAPYH